MSLPKSPALVTRASAQKAMLAVRRVVVTLYLSRKTPDGPAAGNPALLKLL